MTREDVLATVVAVAVAIGAYVVGHRDGGRAHDADAYRVIRDTIVDSIHVVEQRVHVDTVRVRAASALRDSVVTVARTALNHVDSLYTSDSTCIENAGNCARAMPDSLVMPAIVACRSALDADSTVIAELRITVDDALHYGALEQRRAELAEDQLAHRSRFGFKSGAVLGAVVVFALHAFSR